MSHLVPVQSYRSGIGKSTIVTNMAPLLAKVGRQIILVDANLESPVQHAVFGLSDSDLNYTLCDHFNSHCSLSEATYDTTGRLQHGSQITGSLHLIPAIQDTVLSFERDRRLDPMVDVLCDLTNGRLHADFALFAPQQGWVRRKCSSSLCRIH